MNLNKRKTLLLAFVLIVMGLVLLFQNLNQSAIDDTLSKKKSEDYYKLEYALNNGCVPTWLVDTKYSTYEGKDVIIGYGKDRKDKYVFYSDLTAKNINTGKTAVWKCDGIENLDISGNPLPTDEEMHAGAIYDNGGNIVADEYERDENNRILKEERDEIERQNIQRQTDNSYNDVSQSPRWECEQCHQTSYRNEKPCGICGGCEKNRNHEWRNVTRNSPKAECRKCGIISYLQPCRICGGCEKNRNHNFKIFD